MYNVFIAMLDANHTLESLIIYLREALFETHEAALMHTHGVRQRPRPLALSSQLAFLSVLESLSSCRSQWLDSEP